jgi:protein-L-isoaspartate(D-aspartate) O-methyltransferase
MDSGGDRGAKLVEQLRERGICDPAVLNAIRAVPRHEFIGTAPAEAAYLDIALPIACGQTISQPFVVSYMTEKLAAQRDHDVLEIGTGSGYQTAILARICRHVFTIERHEALHDEARLRFARLGIANVTAIRGDGTLGWPEPRQFDRIIVTAAARELPEALIGQLKQGGRMILPLGKRNAQQRLVLFEKMPNGLSRQDLLPVRFVPLVPEKSQK